MKQLVLFLVLTLSFTTFAKSDAEKIAEALADRLSDALELDNSTPSNVHPDTKKRRFEDGNPMWMMLFVRPRQNLLFHNYYAKGFKTTYYSSPFYVNVPDIENPLGFHMKHESPWSVKYAGIGKILFYRSTDFKGKAYKAIVSTDDRPKVFTFGSDNNAVMCFCSHNNPNCPSSLCGDRSKTGSIKMCPGVAFYSKEKYIGDSELLYSCDANRYSEHCFNDVNNTIINNAGSFHFDGAIQEVHLYKNKNCSGAQSWYSFNKQDGTVSKISDFVRNNIRSVKIIFR